LDPAQNGGMYDRDAALRHQIADVAITQLVSDIPSHGLNDKKMFAVSPSTVNTPPPSPRPVRLRGDCALA